MITIPGRLQSKASASEAGRRWLASLPGLCRRLGEEWLLDLGTPYAGCHVSLVLAVSRDDRWYALKIPMPAAIDLGTLAAAARAQELDALRAWAGRGAVQLVEHDPATGAMLLERCVPGTTLDRLADPDESDRAAVDLLHQLWRTPPTDQTFERLADLATRLADDLPQRFAAAGAPFDRWLLEAAVERLGQLAEPGPREVLLHGDFQHANVLSAERQPWLAIDPLPMIGDPAYDAVQYLLFRKGDLADPQTTWPTVIGRFCALLDVDAERVTAWLFARLVSDAVAACEEGSAVAPLEAPQGELWSARLVHQLGPGLSCLQ